MNQRFYVLIMVCIYVNSCEISGDAAIGVKAIGVKSLTTLTVLSMTIVGLHFHFKSVIM